MLKELTGGGSGANTKSLKDYLLATPSELLYQIQRRGNYELLRETKSQSGETTLDDVHEGQSLQVKEEHKEMMNDSKELINHALGFAKSVDESL